MQQLTSGMSFPLVYMFVFMLIPEFCDKSFVAGFEIVTHKSPALFSIKVVLSVWGPLGFHMQFRMGFSVSEKKKKIIGTLIGIVLNL